MAESIPSGYLEDVLFREQSIAIDQLFEQKSAQLFQSVDNGSFVEICVQEPRRTSAKNITNSNVRHAKKDSEISDIEFTCQGIPTSENPPTVEPIPIILDKSIPQSPPRYFGENDIYLYTVSDSWELHDVAAGSQDGFRICFIRQRHPNSRLLLSRDLFDTLMTTFDIFPRFKDFILFFGFKQAEPGLGPPQLRWRTIATSNGHDYATNRDAGYECAYELRYVEPTPHYVNKPWRLRQTAVYHRYRLVDSSSSWVVVSASSSTESSIDQYIKSAGDLTLSSPFDIHLLIVEMSLSNWRPYILNLTEDILEVSDRALATALDGKDSLRSQDIQDRHRLKDIEDELADILVVLDSLYDTVDALLDNYTESVRHSYQLYTGDHDRSSRAFQTQMRDIASSRKSLQSLQTKVQGTNTFLSSLMTLRNSVSLKQIAQEERRENAILQQYSERNEHDSSAVKVLTIIILIYLPITAVCSFFSTRFVTLQSSSSSPDGGEIVVTTNAWLFAAIAAPLTVITLVVWFAWVRLKMFKRKRGFKAKGGLGIGMGMGSL